MSVNSSDVRLELGNPSSNVISDITIENIIQTEGTLDASAMKCAKIIARSFALEADKRLGDARIEYQKRAEYWKGVYMEYTRLNAMPYAGGISKSDKEVNSDDTDNPDYYFYRGMDGEKV